MFAVRIGLYIEVNAQDQNATVYDKTIVKGFQSILIIGRPFRSVEDNAMINLDPIINLDPNRVGTWGVKGE